ncbi:hypothetical protein AYI70_g7444 [Smittium culicis]|uniref:Uncharacterized protein n=1 Tax=Smittium culicis TaxID=133412 RepID=A0A1R1XKN4_9FUNG|nr:hypothetical protein AYI70_g7444 [Smittium culicis]
MFKKKPKVKNIRQSTNSSFHDEDIPTAADIFLAKKKRAMLSKLNSEDSNNSNSLSLDFIPLDSSNQIQYRSKISQSSIFNDLDSTNSESSSRILFNSTSSTTTKIQTQIKLEKLEKEKDKYEYGDVYDFINDVDYTENLSPVEDIIPTDISTNAEINKSKKSIPKSKISKYHDFEIQDIDESDEDNFAWEFERLKNSGVNSSLYSTPTASFSPMNRNTDSYLNLTVNNIKNKPTPQLPNPNDIIKSIQNLVIKNEKIIKLEQEKLLAVETEISNTVSAISKFDSDLEKCSSQIKNFNNLLSLVKN